MAPLGRKVGVGLGAALLAAALALPAIAATSARTTLGGSSPGWATAHNLRGHATSTTRIRVHVALRWRDESALRALIGAVSNPASVMYHRYLTPAQFRAQFAPSQASVDAVSSWLRSQGFAIKSIPANRIWVEATGTVAQAERAFGTKLNLYSVGGRTLRAPAGAISIPSSLRAIVNAVTGLDQTFAVPHAIASDRPSSAPLDELPAAFVNAAPCSHYWGQFIATKKPPAYGQFQPVVPCGEQPGQTRGAYGITHALGTGNNGAGQTVAIIDAFASPTIQADLDTWSARRNLRSTTITQTIFTPDEPIDVGWYSEETLDVESVHAMAPGANIVYIGAADANTGIDDALNYLVENHVAAISSNSYGYLGEQLPVGIIHTETQIFEEAGATGVGMYFSSGDNGDEVNTLGYRTTDWPASSDLVTAVGGTSLAVTANNGYLFETPWQTFRTFEANGNAWSPTPPGTFQYGGGGGTSRIVAEPSYQVGVVPTSISHYWGPANRAVPDVSLNGDPNTGFEIGETQQFLDGTQKYSEYRIGGTSLSCPLLAGIMALADQRAGFSHGFANPALYALYGTSAYRDIIAPLNTIAMVRNDFVDGQDNAQGTFTTLRTTDQLGTLSVLPGYDDSTGMGSPNGEAFLNGLSG
jgi:subtilase family serine protease